jgi:hypothetical protein
MEQNKVAGFEISQGVDLAVPAELLAMPSTPDTAVPAAAPGGGQSRSARRRAKKRTAAANVEQSGPTYPEVPPLASLGSGSKDKGSKAAGQPVAAGKKPTEPSNPKDVKQKEKPKSRAGKQKFNAYKVELSNGRRYILFTKLVPKSEWQMGFAKDKPEGVIKQVEVASVSPTAMVKGDRKAWVGPPDMAINPLLVDAEAWTRLPEKTVQNVPPAPVALANLLQSKTGVEALAALQTVMIPTSLAPSGLQTTTALGTYEVRVPFLPASARDVLRLLEAAFPGVTVALGRVPSSMFATLAAGACKLYTNTHNVLFYYRTCPSWAAGKHLALGHVRDALEPTWGKNVKLGGGPTVLDEVRSSGGPKTMCRHDPMSCDCVSRDPKKHTMMFGMSQNNPPSPREVGKWCARWGTVCTIIPNQAFSQWQVRVARYWRTFQLPGDTEPISLPVNYWYGFEKEAKYFSWREFRRKRLTWKKTPLGAAFVLVEFELVDAPALMAPGALGVSWYQPIEFSMGEELYVGVGGEIVARLSVVEKAALHMAGRALTNDAWNTLERSAARIVAEAPGQIIQHEEARAAAEIAWFQTRQLRIGWLSFGFMRDLLTPLHSVFNHGNLKTSDVLKVAGGLGLALGIVALKPHFNRSLPAASAQLQPQPVQFSATGVLGLATYAVFIAPPAEEYIKHKLGAPGVLAIVVIELWGATTQSGMAGLHAQAMTSLAHFAWWKLGLFWGTLFHMGHNALALAPGLYNMLRALDWVDDLGSIAGDLASALPQVNKSALQVSPGVGAISQTSWHLSLVAWLEGFWPHGLTLSDVPIVGACAAEDGTPMTVEDTQSVEVKIPKVQEECKLRPVCHLLGPGLLCAVPLVYRSCIHNEIAAIRLRLARSQLWFDPSVTLNWQALHNDLRHDPELRTQYWDRMLDEVKPGNVVPTPFDEWNASYPAGQRLINQQAREQARLSGVVGRERQISAFVKVERLPLLLTVEKLKKPVKPRLIQGRQPEVTASSGPTFHALGKVLRRVWPLEGTSRIAYASGCTAETLGVWYTTAVTRGLRPWPTDADMWDASVGPGPHMSEHADLLALGVNEPTRKVLEERRTGRIGRTKHGVVYRLWWQVCSGDGDTSFGNSLANGKMWLGVLRHLPTAMVAINGDNALPMLPEALDLEDVANIVHSFKLYGFSVRLESDSHTIFDGEICSGRLWALGLDEYVYGPKIGRVLAKTFWAIDPPRKARLRRAWVRGVALGLRRDTSFIPVLRVVVGRLIEETRDVPAESVPVDQDEPWKVHAALEHQCAESTMEQVCYLYSITREQVDELEKFLSDLPTLIGVRIDHPVLNRIVEVDLS